MNYRHAFHAGGFADVIKHIVLVRMLVYLQEKPAPFRVLDTHAGAGRYDLTGDEARRGGEWLTGIARGMQARFSEAAMPLLAGGLRAWWPAAWRRWVVGVIGLGMAGLAAAVVAAGGAAAAAVAARGE